MEFDASYNRIMTDENLMETIRHGSNDCPFSFYYENLALFDFHCVEWHWHTEVEFMYVESGTVTVWIGEKQFELAAGEGVFINSKILHRFFSPTETIIPNFVCMPSFIAAPDSFIYRKYVLPVLSSTLSFQTFCRDVPWQAEALSVIRQIIAAQERASSRELATASLIQRLWLELYENADITYAEDPVKDSASSQARVQLMMQYIHQNYPQDISLDDIAIHAGLSKSTVLNLFRKYLHITPVNYLINYRLSEAALALSKTEKKIVTIAGETGFHNVDHFCRMFKRHYHLTPTQYRKKKLEPESLPSAAQNAGACH